MKRDDRRKSRLVVPEERRSDQDRRIHDRVALCLEVDYRCDNTFLFAYITDMSAMGIFIQTETPHRPGTLLNLRFKTPEGILVEAEGRVIWINQPRGAESINPGMGVEFVDLTVAQRDQILKLVRTFAYLSDDEDRIRGHS